MHGAQAAENNVIVDEDMAGQGRAVGHDDAVGHVTIVGHMSYNFV